MQFKICHQTLSLLREVVLRETCSLSQSIYKKKLRHVICVDWVMFSNISPVLCRYLFHTLDSINLKQDALLLSGLLQNNYSILSTCKLSKRLKSQMNYPGSTNSVWWFVLLLLNIFISKEISKHMEIKHRRLSLDNNLIGW